MNRRWEIVIKDSKLLYKIGNLGQGDTGTKLHLIIEDFLRRDN